MLARWDPLILQGVGFWIFLDFWFCFFWFLDFEYLILEFGGLDFAPQRYGGSAALGFICKIIGENSWNKEVRHHDFICEVVSRRFGHRCFHFIILRGVTHFVSMFNMCLILLTMLLIVFESLWWVSKKNTFFSWLNPWAEFPGTHWFFKLVFRSVYVNSQGDKIYSMLWINIHIWRKITQLAAGLGVVFLFFKTFEAFCSSSGTHYVAERPFMLAGSFEGSWCQWRWLDRFWGVSSRVKTSTQRLVITESYYVLYSYANYKKIYLKNFRYVFLILLVCPTISCEWRLVQVCALEGPPKNKL